jgi:hypothetical protein
MDYRRLGREFWDGKPVVDFNVEIGITDPIGSAYRISYDYGAYEKNRTMADVVAELLGDSRSGELTSLVIGTWAEWVGGDSANDIEELVGLLVGASERLPNLTSLFIGDIESEQCEISWIQQGDLSPLFAAFSRLQALGIRGGNRLTLGIPQHANLKKLILESGGLPVSVVREVAAADFPALEHLELYLGEGNYGWDGSIDDLTPFFEGSKWPNLKYLGLRDSQIADEIAERVATAPVLERIKVLDISLGTLSDVGAEALLSNRAALSRLEKLDVHHHYLTERMVSRLRELGISVDTSDPQDEYAYGDESYRYVAVGE